MTPLPRAVLVRILLLTVACLAARVPLYAADPATFQVGSFTFKRPASLSWVPVNSSMRKAQLHFADPANATGPGADIVFFYFGAGQGGGVDANLARWVGQFAEKEDQLKPTVETATINGTKITRVHVDRGTFSSGMPGSPTTPMAGYGLYGAILESASGDVFIKMTGPGEAVKAAAEDFDSLIRSAFP